MNNNTPAIFEEISKSETITPTTLNGLPGMSSLEVAEITGKRHDHILRDIKMMVGALASRSPNLGSQVVHAQYRDTRGKLQPMVVLDKELTFTLLARYSFELSNLIVKRWFELEGSGFTRVSVQESVAHLIEREKDNRREAFKGINRVRAKRPLSPAAKERNRLERQAKAYERANPSW